MAIDHCVNSRAVRRGVSVVLAAVLGVAAFAPLAAAGRAYHAETYRVTLAPRTDGSVRVREEIRLRFDGGPFTFFHRGIPLRYSDGVEGIIASDSIRIRPRRNRVDVTWSFAPCRDTTRAFWIEYEARGVLYTAGGTPRLRWFVFPAEERPYRIEAASAVVLLPARMSPPTSVATRPVGLIQGRRQAEAGEIELGPVRLAPNRTVRLEINLPAGSLEVGEPGWRLEQIRWAGRLPVVLVASVALLALGLFWLFRWRSDLSSRLAPGTAGARVRRRVLPVSEPPEAISPALSGALMLGQPSMPHLFAVLFDLARQGVVRIEPKAGRRKWSRTRAVIHRGNASWDAQPWERVVVDVALERAKPDGSVDWQRAAASLGRHTAAYNRAVEAGLVQRGLFDPAGLEGRWALRRRLLLLGAFDALAGLAGLLLLEFLGPAAFLPMAAMAVVTLATAITKATFPVRTRRGTELATSWRGFAHTLGNAPKEPAMVDAARLSAWLPHAIALGVGAQWVKAARKARVPAPEWFCSDELDLDARMHVLTAMVAVSSVSGGGGRGAGGAAGGGNSGAG